jgi:hypothetical protein
MAPTAVGFQGCLVATVPASMATLLMKAEPGIGGHLHPMVQIMLGAEAYPPILDPSLLATVLFATATQSVASKTDLPQSLNENIIDFIEVADHFNCNTAIHTDDVRPSMGSFNHFGGGLPLCPVSMKSFLR